MADLYSLVLKWQAETGRRQIASRQTSTGQHPQAKQLLLCTQNPVISADESTQRL
jgi:hypothetical protein